MVENMAAGGELAGLKVMVIDDSRTIRRTAETLLAREGCEVVTATETSCSVVFIRGSGGRCDGRRATR